MVGFSLGNDRNYEQWVSNLSRSNVIPPINVDVARKAGVGGQKNWHYSGPKGERQALSR